MQEMKALKIQNSVLRAKNRRLEEDNQRKQKEITSFYDGNKVCFQMNQYSC